MKPNAPQNETARLADKSFNRSIAISILCILLCAAALCSTSWAWFSSDASSSNRIATATCTVTVSVQDGEGTPLLPSGEGEYSFAANTVYTVAFLSEGTAQSSYCALTVNGVRYYTEQISTVEPENTMSFRLSFSVDTLVSIHTYWGTFGRPERDLLSDQHYENMQAVTIP